MQEFSDDLRNYVDRDKATKPSDNTIEVRRILKELVMASGLTAALAKEFEFLYDGTISKEVFLKRYAEIEKRYEAELAGLA